MWIVLFELFKYFWFLIVVYFLCRLREKGLFGYMMENNIFIFCVESLLNLFLKDKILKIIKDEFEFININVMEKLFIVYYGIIFGKKLYFEIYNVSKYGILGMFGFLWFKKGGNLRRCCIFSVYVVLGG